MIETDRLTLRGWLDRDLEPYAAMCADPEVMRHLGGVQSRAESNAVVDQRRAELARDGYTFWTAERRADRMFLGLCGLKPGPKGTPIEGEIEIGWRLRRDVWGQGYALEAARASLGWGWANLDVPSIAAITIPANVRSWRFMERLGMTRCPDEDFDHSALAPGDPLRRHVTYRIARPS